MKKVNNYYMQTVLQIDLIFIITLVMHNVCKSKLNITMNQILNNFSHKFVVNQRERGVRFSCVFQVFDRFSTPIQIIV